MGEKEEYDQLLKRARQLAQQKKITVSEALLLVVAHELICLHFHVDSGFVLGAIKHVDDKGKE